MIEELLPHYERELGYVRELGREFARRYPAIAGRLAWNGDVCADPHVERLIEAFAFVAARLHRRMDDGFPELTTALLEHVFPHYLRPFPACTIVQAQATAGSHNKLQTLARHSLIHAQPIDGVRCAFRLASPIELLPLRVEDVQLSVQPGTRARGGGSGVLTLNLRAQPGVSFATLPLSRLRFFLDAPPLLAHRLYEWLLRSPQQVDAGIDLARAPLPADSIQPCGFAADEALVPDDVRTFPGFRLWLEYFAFPERFLFIDVCALDAPSLPRQRWQDTLQIRWHLQDVADDDVTQRLLRELKAHHFKLGCAPAINLFAQQTDPVTLHRRQSRYRLSVDARRPQAYEIYSIEQVRHVARRAQGDAVSQVPPMFGNCHFGDEQALRFFWHAQRQDSLQEGDRGRDVELQLVESHDKHDDDTEVLSVATLACNRDWPARMPFGGSNTRFDSDASQLSYQLGYLRKPSPVLRAPMDAQAQWVLISLLTLQQQTLIDSEAENLRQLLHVLNFANQPGVRRQINGLRRLQATPTVARVQGPCLPALARGLHIEVEIDSEAFVGHGVYLFGSVLERFLALRSAPNQFVRVSLRDSRQEQPLALWPPRCGEDRVL